MDCPMIKDGDGKMMMHDMMQIMKDVLTIQKQMLPSPTAETRIKIEADLSATIEKMDKMMSASNHMTMDMQKPATGRQQKEAPMPMDHEHQCLCRSA
jgi:hypothetical protein